jgi:hypothetical protein
MLKKFKVAIQGDKKSCEMYRQDCEITIKDTGLNVINVEALEDEIDTLDDDGFDDARENDDFSTDWMYYYLVTVETEMSNEELEKFLYQNLSFYSLESEIE